MKAVQRSIQQRHAEDATPLALVAAAGAARGDAPGASEASHAMASVRAIQNELMINADGSMAPLTLRQRLWYGSRKHLLIERLSYARRHAQRIADILTKPLTGELFKKLRALLLN